MQTATVMRDGSIHCPKCNGASLSVRRRLRDYLFLGLFMPRRMQCNSCGTWCDRPMYASSKS